MKTFRQFLNEDFGDYDIFNNNTGPFSSILSQLIYLITRMGFVQWNDIENWFNEADGEILENLYNYSMEWLDINGDGYFGPEDMEFFVFMDFITKPPPYGTLGIELPEEFLSPYGYGANGGVFDMSAFLEWWNGYIQDIIAQGEPYPESLEDYIQDYIGQGEGYSDENPWGTMNSPPLPSAPGGFQWGDFEGKGHPNGDPWTRDWTNGIGPENGFLPMILDVIPPGILNYLGYEYSDVGGGKGDPIERPGDQNPQPSYDFDGDGDVDFDDLLYLLSNYDELGFDYEDLIALLSKFGKKGLLPPDFPKPPRPPKQPPKQPPSPPPPGLAGPKG